MTCLDCAVVNYWAGSWRMSLSMDGVEDGSMNVIPSWRGGRRYVMGDAPHLQLQSDRARAMHGGFSRPKWKESLSIPVIKSDVFAEECGLSAE